MKKRLRKKKLNQPISPYEKRPSSKETPVRSSMSRNFLCPDFLEFREGAVVIIDPKGDVQNV